MKAIKRYLAQIDKKLLPAIILIGSLCLFIIIVFVRPQRSQAPLSEQSWQVATLTAKRSDHIPQLILYGITESPHETTLRAAVKADVIEINAHEGDIVKKDQILIRLDDRDDKLLVSQRAADVNVLESEINAEKIRYEADKKLLEHEKQLVHLSQKDLQRQTSLKSRFVAAEVNVDEARRILKQNQLAVTSRELAIQDHINRLNILKARLVSAKAKLEQAKLDLSRTTLRAPFDARITNVPVSIGDRIQVGDPLVELYDLNAVEVRAQVPNEAVDILHKALKIEKKLHAKIILDKQTIHLTLANLAGKVQSGRGGVDALFFVEETDVHLALGRTVKVTLSLPKVKGAYAIPVSALYAQDIVYIVKNNRMQAIKVSKIGTAYEKNKGRNQIIIQTDEIKENDLIIITQLPNARDGLLVVLR